METISTDAPARCNELNVSHIRDEIERTMTRALETTTSIATCRDDVSSSGGDSGVIMSYSTCSTARAPSARFGLIADDIDDIGDGATQVTSARNGSVSRHLTRLNAKKTDSGATETKKRKGLMGFFNRILAAAGSKTDPAGQSDGQNHVAIASDVRVVALPQVFLVKYLGMSPCSHLWGSEHIRAPVAQLVEQFQERRRTKQPLPLIQLHVTKSGVHTSALTRQDIESRLAPNVPSKDAELVPIELISFGTQDATCTRVFSFVVVREISSRSRRLECHVYVCDSTLSARRLALSLSLAFRLHSQERGDKPFELCVDLRQTSDLSDGSDKVSSGETDFDA